MMSKGLKKIGPSNLDSFARLEKMTIHLDASDAFLQKACCYVFCVKCKAVATMTRFGSPV